MSNIVKIAKETRKRLNYDVNKDALLQLCHDRGYDIMHYDPEEEHGLISHLGIDEFAKQAKAFASIPAKMIFVRKGYDEKTEAYLLAHELGHIVLKHDVQPGTDNTNQEREANQFAEELLKPCRALRLISQYKRGATALVLTAVLSSVAGFWIGQSVEDPAAPIIENTVTAPAGTDTVTDTVYVTRSGEKYHVASCRYIEGKTDLREMTVDEAIEQRYAPCKVCIK